MTHPHLNTAMLSLFGALCATACGDSQPPAGGIDTPPGTTPRVTFEGPVARAQCGVDDLVETGLQGQVAQTDCVSGRSLEGYQCNLERVGHFDNDGEGAGWQFAWFEDCGYMGTAKAQTGIGTGVPRGVQLHPGVQVIDVSDPTAPIRATALTTQGMLDPWESLKVNERRALLADVDGEGGGGSAFFDIYDLSGDCRNPQLLASVPIGESVGHAGHFAPDGLTYYGSPLQEGLIKAIDISNPSAPTVIKEDFPTGTHDLSISQDGTRAYLADTSPNGLTILDVSEIQNRVPDPQVSVIGEVSWQDGSTAQMTQRITIDGTPYILFVDELGQGAARLVDISDETAPFIASKLKLDVHMPENDDAVAADAGSLIFGYEGHYCTASDTVNNNTTYDVENTRIIVCSYFESGLRVFDVRDPYAPREIAYYIPPVLPGARAGSYYNLGGLCQTVDWASSHPRYIPEREEIWFTSQCGGFHVLRFSRPIADLLTASATAGQKAGTETRGAYGGTLTFGLLVVFGIAIGRRRR